MNIFTVTCEEAYCAPMHFTARHRAEAAKTAHYIAIGHTSVITESRVQVGP